MSNSCYTITFGDCAENGVGMQIIGNSVDLGYSSNDLYSFCENLTNLGIDCELIDLKKDLPNTISSTDFTAIPKTSVLIIRNLAEKILSDNDKHLHQLIAEISSLKCDTKCLSYGKVKNKIARYNLCFSDFSQEPEYKNGKGTVVDFSDVPLLNIIRNSLPDYFGIKSKDLQAELNYYYDVTKCGIGYHGDTERKIVIGMRLGKTIPLTFRWYKNCEPIDDNIIRINDLNSGDFYVFSKNAVGTNWKKRNIYTIRHAAGASKYIE